MKQELWLGREYDKNGFYVIFQGKPSPEDLDGDAGSIGENGIKSGRRGMIDCFCPKMFHLISPIRLRKGRKKRIKRIVIELEE